MASCHDMKKGDIFTCGECGIELQVIKECEDANLSAEECGCHDEEDQCAFSCCGKPLIRKD